MKSISSHVTMYNIYDIKIRSIHINNTRNYIIEKEIGDQMQLLQSNTITRFE
jgi:hypothetical protein